MAAKLSASQLRTLYAKDPVAKFTMPSTAGQLTPPFQMPSSSSSCSSSNTFGIPPTPSLAGKDLEFWKTTVPKFQELQAQSTTLMQAFSGLKALSKTVEETNHQFSLDDLTEQHYNASRLGMLGAAGHRTITPFHSSLLEHSQRTQARMKLPLRTLWHGTFEKNLPGLEMLVPPVQSHLCDILLCETKVPSNQKVDNYQNQFLVVTGTEFQEQGDKKMVQQAVLISFQSLNKRNAKWGDQGQLVLPPKGEMEFYSSSMISSSLLNGSVIALVSLKKQNTSEFYETWLYKIDMLTGKIETSRRVDQITRPSAASYHYVPVQVVSTDEKIAVLAQHLFMDGKSNLSSVCMFNHDLSESWIKESQADYLGFSAQAVSPECVVVVGQNTKKFPELLWQVDFAKSAKESTYATLDQKASSSKDAAELTAIASFYDSANNCVWVSVLNAAGNSEILRYDLKTIALVGEGEELQNTVVRAFASHDNKLHLVGDVNASKSAQFYDRRQPFVAQLANNSSLQFRHVWLNQESKPVYTADFRRLVFFKGNWLCGGHSRPQPTPLSQRLLLAQL